MDPDDSSKLKFVFVSLNSIFALIGVSIFAVGAYIQFSYHQYIDFVGDSIWIAATAFMLIGAVIACISILGCSGALKENYCMLLMFSIILAVIFGVQVIGIITLSTQCDQVDKIMEQKMNQTFTNHNVNEDSQLAWKMLQNELRCCGINGPTDWENQYPGEPLPKSCCHEFPADVTEFNIDCAEKEGCLPKLRDWLKGKAVLFLCFGFFISLIPLFFLCCACRLCKPFKRRYQTV